MGNIYLVFICLITISLMLFLFKRRLPLKFVDFNSIYLNTSSNATAHS